MSTPEASAGAEREAPERPQRSGGANGGKQTSAEEIDLARRAVNDASFKLTQARAEFETATAAYEAAVENWRMLEPPPIGPQQRQVLRFLVRCSRDEFGFHGFAGIAARTKLTRAQVKRACRQLRAKGLARFERACWTDDGVPAGGAYGATKAGQALIAREEGTEP